MRTWGNFTGNERKHMDKEEEQSPKMSVLPPWHAHYRRPRAKAEPIRPQRHSFPPRRLMLALKGNLHQHMWWGIKSALGRSRCCRWRSGGAWSGWLLLCGAPTHGRTYPSFPSSSTVSSLSSSPHPNILPFISLPLTPHPSSSHLLHSHHPDFMSSLKKTGPPDSRAF